MPAGRKLRALRNARKLTTREVEYASRRIAAVKGDKRFCISNSWLTQIENGVSEPGIFKLFSLSAIYKVKFRDLIRLYEINIDDIEQFEPVANPYLTQLLSAEDHNGDVFPAVTEPLRSSLNLRPTSLLPPAMVCASPIPINQFRNSLVAPISYGYVGLKDITMYPMIRPGSLVRIDTSQNKIERLTRHSEYDRPIYFVELRDAYACGWVELQGNELLIIPHHSSPARIRRFTYIKDAEIVGRVVGYDTRCVEHDN